MTILAMKIKIKNWIVLLFLIKIFEMYNLDGIKYFFVAFYLNKISRKKKEIFNNISILIFLFISSILDIRKIVFDDIKNRAYRAYINVLR